MNDCEACIFCSLLSFIFYRNSEHPDLHVLTHSFPTRRASDLDFSALVIANALLTRLKRAPRFAAVDVAPRTTMERREGKEAQQCRNHFPVFFIPLKLPGIRAWNRKCSAQFWGPGRPTGPRSETSLACASPLEQGVPSQSTKFLRRCTRLIRAMSGRSRRRARPGIYCAAARLWPDDCGNPLLSSGRAFASPAIRLAGICSRDRTSTRLNSSH